MDGSILFASFCLFISASTDAQQPNNSIVNNPPYLTDSDFHMATQLTTEDLYRRRVDVRPWSNGPRDSSKKMRFRNGVPDNGSRWPNAQVPYQISSQYSQWERAVIARSIQAFHDRTCVRFIPRSGQRDYVFIGKLDNIDCWSDGVGRVGGRQEVSLGNDCIEYGSIIHELLHAVGFHHEHERYDRDGYITILWQNIDRDAYDQFQKASTQDMDLLGEAYDYYSIMHYDRKAFSSNGQNTIEAKQPAMTLVIGEGNDFSPADLRKVQKMYRCDSTSAAAAVAPQTSYVAPQPAAVWPAAQTSQVVAPQWPASQGSQVVAPQWPAPQPVVQTTVACEDKSNACYMWIGLCKNSGFANTLSQVCAKTCNFCTTPSASAAVISNPSPFFAQWSAGR